MLGVVAGAARLFGLKVDTETQGAFREAGERLWVELGPLFGRKAGRTFMAVFLGSIDPSAAAIVEALEAEGALPSAQDGLPLEARLGLARFAPKVGVRVMRNLARPAAGRERLSRAIDRGAREAAALLSGAGGGAEVAAAMRGLAEELAPSILPVLLGGIVSSQVPFQVLLRLAREAGAEDEALELTRGLSHNVTTEMDLALWDAAEAIRSDPLTLEACARLDARGFSGAYRAGELPKAAQEAFGSFIERYGFRGAGEIDIGMPRWREDPAAVAGALLSYLSIDAEASPRAIFEKGARRAAEAARRVEEAIRKAQGPLKGRLARFLAGRLRELGGLRESPKYGIMRILGQLRSSLLAEGARLAQAGRIEEAEDIFFLRGSEIAGSGSLELKRLVEERKASREREMRRVRVPRLLAGDGRAWYDAPSSAEEGSRSLRGSPVSPGVAEGRARVVFDPAKAALEKGDILVCRATDPAWTPLFLAAAALVTEVGGQMTHGSVVAREYGIPAVVGVADATARIADLSRIRVDGAAGLVFILEEADGGQPPGVVPSSP
jgi:pyruvate,water dikinase